LPLAEEAGLPRESQGTASKRMRIASIETAQLK